MTGHNQTMPNVCYTHIVVCAQLGMAEEADADSL